MKILRVIFLLLLVAGPRAQAYVLSLNSLTNAEHWNFLSPSASVPTNVLDRTTHAVRFYLASDGFSTTNTAAELNAVRACFGQWQSISNTLIKFEDAGLVNPPVDVNTSDGTNIVYWVKGTTLVDGGNSDISGALGETFKSFTTTDNQILQADIVFNGDLYDWFTDFFNPDNNSTFVEDVALHEIGHYIGLNHSPAGAATMFYAGGLGINAQDGLSSDDVSAARFLYSTTPGIFGAISGSVTVGGSPVTGAIVTAEDSNTNIYEATLTWTNGVYWMGALPPGIYTLRVTPLDPAADRGVDALCTGPDVSPDYYDNSFTSFGPTASQTTTVAAAATNTVNFTITSNVQPFRITNVRFPTQNSGSYSWAPLPAAMTVGQSNYFIGVASSNLPSGATLTITGNGLTIGTPTYQPDPFVQYGLNFLTVPISVSSNATPGLRSFVVQVGTNVAYANGFLKIRPAVLDYNFDGLDDTFQRFYFPVFTASNAAPTADPDADGMDNLQEYIAGTNPTNVNSVLKMGVVSRSGSTAVVHWQSVTNKQYQVFSRSNLTSAAWQTIGSTVTASGTNSQFTDSHATNGTDYYRVQVLQ